MSIQKRILRAIGVCVVSVAAVLAGLYIRQVVIDGGQFAPGMTELVVAGVTGLVIGFVAPDAAERKKNRDNFRDKLSK